eukprot:jgi/Chrpa1/5759/Chrysochromulina_OHIO_Genome00012432-RA
MALSESAATSTATHPLLSSAVIAHEASDPVANSATSCRKPALSPTAEATVRNSALAPRSMFREEQRAHRVAQDPLDHRTVRLARLAVGSAEERFEQLSRGVVALPIAPRLLEGGHGPMDDLCGQQERNRPGHAREDVQPPKGRRDRLHIVLVQVLDQGGKERLRSHQLLLELDRIWVVADVIQEPNAVDGLDPIALHQVDQPLAHVLGLGADFLVARLEKPKEQLALGLAAHIGCEHVCETPASSSTARVAAHQHLECLALRLEAEQRLEALVCRRVARGLRHRRVGELAKQRGQLRVGMGRLARIALICGEAGEPCHDAVDAHHSGGAVFGAAQDHDQVDGLPSLRSRVCVQGAQQDALRQVALQHLRAGLVNLGNEVHQGVQGDPLRAPVGVHRKAGERTDRVGGGRILGSLERRRQQLWSRLRPDQLVLAVVGLRELGECLGDLDGRVRVRQLPEKGLHCAAIEQQAVACLRSSSRDCVHDGCEVARYGRGGLGERRNHASERARHGVQLSGPNAREHARGAARRVGLVRLQRRAPARQHVGTQRAIGLVEQPPCRRVLQLVGRIPQPQHANARLRHIPTNLLAQLGQFILEKGRSCGMRHCGAVRGAHEEPRDAGRQLVARRALLEEGREHLHRKLRQPSWRKERVLTRSLGESGHGAHLAHRNGLGSKPAPSAAGSIPTTASTTRTPAGRASASASARLSSVPPALSPACSVLSAASSFTAATADASRADAPPSITDCTTGKISGTRGSTCVSVDTSRAAARSLTSPSVASRSAGAMLSSAVSQERTAVISPPVPIAAARAWLVVATTLRTAHAARASISALSARAPASVREQRAAVGGGRAPEERVVHDLRLEHRYRAEGDDRIGDAPPLVAARADGAQQVRAVPQIHPLAKELHRRLESTGICERRVPSRQLCHHTERTEGKVRSIEAVGVQQRHEHAHGRAFTDEGRRNSTLKVG